MVPMPKPARSAPPAQKPATLPSPARQALDAVFRDLREAEAGSRAAREPVDRLAAEIDCELPAAAVLQALEAEDAAAMAEWARCGAGPAPEPRQQERQDAAARLALMQMKAGAAAGALPAVRAAAADAEQALAVARERIGPAVAQVLREDGARLALEYWRRYAALELIRRELAGLDQVLAADFPSIHAATGLPVTDWISPDKLSAPDAMRAIDRATTSLAPIEAFAADWKARAAGLMGE